MRGHIGHAPARSGRRAKEICVRQRFCSLAHQNEVDHFGSPDWLALINMASDLQRTKIRLSQLKGMSPSGIWAEM
jgi:hypothetical protein